MLKSFLVSASLVAGILQVVADEAPAQTAVLMKGELTDVAQQFVGNVKAVDTAAIRKMSLQTPALDTILAGLEKAADEFKSEQIKFSYTGKQIVIGDLAAILIRIEYVARNSVEYEAFLWCREGKDWKWVPRSKPKDIEEFSRTRSPDEQIHIVLFDEWQKRMEKYLTKGKVSSADKAEVAVESRVKVDMNYLTLALRQYNALSGAYPTSEQGLKALVEKPETPPVPKRYAAVLRELPKDAWGRDYQYSNKNGKVKIWSMGASQEDEEDDLVKELN